MYLSTLKKEAIVEWSWNNPHRRAVLAARITVSTC